MTKQDTLTFEEVVERHVPLLFSWLNSVRLKGIYDEGYSSQEDVARKYLAKSGTIKRFIVSLKGSPFGYIQVYDVLSSHKYAKYRSSKEVTKGVDLFIGDEFYLRKGYGFQVLKEFIPFLGREVDRVLVDPLKGNSSVELFKKYGFKELESINGHLILAIDIRYTARAILINEQKQILLMKIEDNITIDASRPDDHFWVTIGGTIEKGEDEIQALTREIQEETGIGNFAIGKLVFYGEHTLLFHHFPVRHFEKFYFVYIEEERTHQGNLTENEKRVFRDIRFWSIQQLLSADEVVYPRSLAQELSSALNGGMIPREITL
ncbi:MAG: Bifunctional AAC/APH [Chlamydiae bacterium]|nr:Bifunctional AAC/APH [Chlamydiota bacterium]